MALRLYRKGGQIDEHQDLKNRELPDQHPMEAITGLNDKFDVYDLEIENLNTSVNTLQDMIITNHDELGNRELPDQHPIEAITGLHDILSSLMGKGAINTVATFADLDSIPNKDDETFAAVVDLNILYRYDEVTMTWIAMSGGDGVIEEGGIKYEFYISQEGQTVFNLYNKYTPGSHILEVYMEGILLQSNMPDSKGSVPDTYDYEETNSHTVTFIKPRLENQTIIFKISRTAVKIEASSPLYETFRSNHLQQVFTLNNSYIPGTNTLDVYVEGVLVRSNTPDSNGLVDLNIDYYETDDHTITFKSPLEEDTLVIFKINTMNISPSTIKSYEWEPMESMSSFKRLKKETITGDINRVTDYIYDIEDRVIREDVTESGITKSKTFIYDGFDIIQEIDTEGANRLTVHRLSISGKKIFEFDNATEIVCIHELDTKYIHVTVWVDDTIYNDCIIQRQDNNSVIVTSLTPISGEIVIS